MQPGILKKIFELYEHDELLRAEYFKLLDDFSSHISNLTTMLSASGYTADSEALWNWFMANGQLNFPKSS